MTKEEFEQSYCNKSRLSKEEYDKHFVTMSCSCQYEECEGWAVVTNSPLAIEAHKRLYQN
jgi:hypothetical protein